MPQYCIVQLDNSTDETFNCLSFEQDGTIMTDPARLSLEAIAATSQGKTLLCLLPAMDTLLINVELPMMKRNRLLKAIPFALEEQLSDNLSAYHFTLLYQSESGQTQVAVIEKKRLEHWLQLFAEHNLQIDFMIPQQLAVPYQENTWSIDVTKGYCLVRSGQAQGFVTDSENLANLLTIHLGEATLPEKIIIADYEANHHIDGAALSHQVQMPVDITQHPENAYLPQAAKVSLDNLNSNLLQGDYRPKSKHKRIKQIWQLALLFLILWIALLVVNKIVQLTVYAHQNVKLNQQINAIYKQNFPDATDIVAPKLRMQEKINQIKAVANGNPFIDLIGRTGDVLKNINNLKITHIDFQNNTLSLKVEMRNFSDLRTVIDLLKRHQLNVTQNNAQTHENKITATLVIHQQGASA